jgi:hypothetical protein
MLRLRTRARAAQKARLGQLADVIVDLLAAQAELPGQFRRRDGRLGEGEDAGPQGVHQHRPAPASVTQSSAAIAVLMDSDRLLNLLCQ